MIHAIFLATDGFEYGNAAQQSAIALAKRFNAEITAVGAVDTPWRITPQGKLEQLDSGRPLVQEALRQLQATAIADGIAATSSLVEGDLNDALSAEAVRHDLIVIGRSPNLRASSLHLAIDRLAHNGARAVLAVSDKPASADRILVAFDGSVPASRSLHMAALLGFAQSGRVQLLSVNSDSRAAEAAADRAASLLRSHGATVAAFGIASESDPAEIILSHAQTFEADMIVMGAYGHGGLRDMVFGSWTRRVVAECPTALFLQH
jgi:nucleotide-binding universal stress UspA family protein